MQVSIIDGNLLDQEVDVIVNAWNRNIIPWWLLLPHKAIIHVSRHQHALAVIGAIHPTVGAQCSTDWPHVKDTGPLRFH